MLVADVDRDATFQLKLTRKLDQWHAFHERATRRLSGSADGSGPSTDQPANVHPLEVDQSDDATCPSEPAESSHDAEMRTEEAKALAAEGVAWGAEGEARAASGEARAAKGVALAGATALETREAKAAESENAAVAPKQLEAAADARGAALEAALQVQGEELEAKAVVIQELQVRLHAAETREAGLEASLKQQREELEAKAAVALAARAAEAAELQERLDEAISREAAFDASLKLQREELESKAAEVQGLQEQLQEAGVREAAFDASLKLQREELEAKAAEALAAQAGLEERRRVRAAEEAAARFAEVEARLGEVERERERLARNLSRLQQHLLDRDADDALRLEREAERIRHLECQLADKGKALGQSECERVVLERQLADKASQLSQSERRRTQLDQQLEERSREVREARIQLARLQARTEPGGQARQEAQALCWQRQAQLEEALSEVAAGRRERGALEEELLRLQCALDQCMLRLNSDSAYMVDRRIVVKLLVAYFQRNRSREVLDIMCRILECSKDERQQLELAASHPALTRSASFKSKGSVRQGSSKGSKGGVFGLPGRIAGGFLGSNRSVSENLGEPGRDSHGQHEAERKPEARKAGSLTDLWVSIPSTAAHVPTAAGETHPITLLSPKISPLPAAIPVVSS
ncbi:unnamed protein product [Closterium sp. Naga37s-1]|nr:unnamed protein product [Closterium sp. Naga37s-1]